MVDKMTIEEFLDKVEWEGGWYEAVLGCGLSEKNLDDNTDPVFIDLVRMYCILANQLDKLEDRLIEWE